MPKALAERDGRRWADLALDVLRAGGCDPLLVVLGAAADEVRRVATLDGALVVENPAWAEGIGSSLRAGLAALTGTEADAAVVLLVDTPGITPAAVRRVAAAGAGGDPAGALAIATYAGRDGHPVLLGRAHWPGVAALATGDTGARAYLRAHPGEVHRIPCDDIAIGDDIDTRA
jgi:nicotine blue oxidoreductase